MPFTGIVQDLVIQEQKKKISPEIMELLFSTTILADIVVSINDVLIYFITTPETKLLPCAQFNKRYFSLYHSEKTNTRKIMYSLKN